jgi:hypothetical protein
MMDVDANFLRVDFDALGECAEVIAAVAARLGPHAPAGLLGERFEDLSRCSAPAARSASARA